MTLLKLLSPADYFSIANGAIGALGILYFIDGGEKHIMIGIALIYVAMFMDGLDGAIARRFGSKHNLGVYLDSMADSVSFCFAPAVFVYKVFYDIAEGSAFENIDNFLAVATAISIATVGIVRLASFSYYKENKLHSFVGLPTPSMTFFVLTGGIIFRDYNYIILPATIVIVSLMLMNFPYPKITTRNLVLIAILGLLSGLLGAFMGALNIDHYKIPLMISFAIILIYILFPLITVISGKRMENEISTDPMKNEKASDPIKNEKTSDQVEAKQDI